jgi:hypothetical protein
MRLFEAFVFSSCSVRMDCIGLFEFQTGLWALKVIRMIDGNNEIEQERLAETTSLTTRLYIDRPGPIRHGVPVQISPILEDLDTNSHCT